MATVDWSKQVFDGGAIVYTWTLTGTDDGKPVTMPRFGDRSVDLEGTFGGGTILIEGTNVMAGASTDYKTLRDQADTFLSFTTDDLKLIVPVCVKIRPRASVSVTSVKVSLLILGTGRN